jgi:hypothetical protein
MDIQKYNDYYNKEYTNDIEEYTFTPTSIQRENIDFNDLKDQNELDIQLNIDILGKSKLELKIPLDI